MVVLREGEKAPLGCGVVVVDDVTTVALLLTGLLDPAKEIEKLKVKQVRFLPSLPSAISEESCLRAAAP